jgi:hypothetical protein
METNLEIKQPKKDYALSLRIEDAISHPLKIHNADDDEIKKALAYCFAATGLPETSIPKGLTRSFLIQFVKDNFKFYAVEEIKTAFTMAVKGDLNITSRNGDVERIAKHYNNFSPEYFASIMGAYRSHREKASLNLLIKNKEKTKVLEVAPDSIQKAAAQREYDDVILKPMFENYKIYKTIVLGHTTARLVFNSLVSFHEVKTFSEVELKENEKRALETFKTSEAKTFKDYKKKIQILSEVLDNQKTINEIENGAFEIGIKQCFDEMIKNNFKF